MLRNFTCIVLMVLITVFAAQDSLAQPQIGATLQDDLVVDTDADTQADRGDTLGYQVVLENQGDTEAGQVQLDIPMDPNLTLDPASVQVGPIALDDTASVTQGGDVVIPVLDNDRDVDGTLDPSTVQVVSGPASGTTAVNTTTGEVTYTASGASGAAAFAYTVADDDGMVSRAAQVSVNVNACPVAQDDDFTTDAASAAAGNVLDDNGSGADSDADAGDTLSITAVNGAAGGVGVEIALASGALLTLNSDGTFDYDPNGAFDALALGQDDTDSFTYTLSDGICPATATVTLTVTGVNECPVAQDDALTTSEDAPAAGDLLADNGSGVDSDPDTSDVLSITAVNGVPGQVGSAAGLASGAVLTVNADGSFDYDPNGQFEALAAGEDDTDSFTYTLSDGTCPVTGAVTITVTGVNDCPVAQADAVTTDEDTPLSGNVLDNNGSGADGDADTSDVLSITEVNGAAGGVGVEIALASGALLTLNSDGSFDYDPNGQFEALAAGEDDTDSFTYTLSDGACPVTGTVTITLTGVNDCPVAQADAVTTDEDTLLDGNVLSDNGSGADSDADTSDAFSITEVNGAAGGVGVEVVLVSGALLTLNSDGTFDYDPNGQFESLADGGDDTDSFTYTLSDGACPVTGTVTITVTGVNDCPVAQADAVTTDEATPLNGSVFSNNGSGADTDPDTGDTLAVTEVNGVAGDVGAEIALASGALLTLNSDGTFDYDPNGAFEAVAAGSGDTDSFTYTLGDGTPGCASTATVTLTINGLNDCPDAKNDAFTATESVGASGNLLSDNGSGADSDADTGASLTITAVNGNGGAVGGPAALASGALVQVNANGTFTYNPNGAFEALGAGDEDSDSFTYTLSDGTCTANATVTVGITGENDAPTAAAQFSAATGNLELAGNSGGLTAAATASPSRTDTLINLLTGAADVDSPTLSVVAASGASAQGGTFEVFADGSFLYTPAAGFTGNVDSFTYSVSDGAASSAAATVTIAVSNLVWFINNDVAGTNGDGRAVDPFRSTAEFNAANGAGAGAPATGQRIYLFNGTGSYTGGITLLDNQVLEGQGVDLVIGVDTLAAATSAPVISAAAGSGVNLASGNTLRGFNVANTPNGYKLDGGAVGNLVVNNVSLTGTGGAIRVTTSGSFGSNVVLGTLESTSATGANLSLTGVTGTLALGSAGSGFSGAGATAVQINGGSLSLTYPGAITVTGQSLFNIQSRTAGTLTFSGALSCTGATTGGLIQGNAGGTIQFSNASKVFNTSGDAITLASNAGTTVQFSGGGLQITTTAGTPLVASGGGTLQILGAGNAASATARPALDVDNLTFNASFTTLSSASSTTTGLDLSNLLSGSTLTLTGALTISGPAGVGVTIDDVEAGSTLSFAGATITNRGSHGFFIQDFDGTSLSFGDADVTNGLNAGGNGVFVRTSGGGATSTGALSFSSLDISSTNATVNRNDAGGDGIPDNETDDGHGIKLMDHTGTFTITGLGTQANGGTLQNIEGDGISLRRSGGLSLNKVIINNIGTSNQAAASVDNAGIYAYDLVGANSVVNSTISRFQDGSVGGGSSCGVSVTNNNVSFINLHVTDTTFFNDSSLLGDDGIQLITNNTVSGALVVDSAFNLGNIGNASEFHHISGTGVQVIQNGGGTLTTNISDTTFRDTITPGGFGGIDLSSAGSGIMSNTIDECLFLDLYPGGVNNSGVITFFATGTVDYDGTVNNCTFGSATQRTSDGRGAIRASTDTDLAATVTDFDITITNNVIDDTDREAISILPRGGAVPQASGNTMDITISGNSIGQTTPVANDAGLGREGIEFVSTESAKLVNLTVTNNLITNFVDSTSDETLDIKVNGSTSLYAVITGNVFSQSGSAGTADSVDASINSTGLLCLDMNSANTSQNICPHGITITETAGTYSIQGIGGAAIPAATVDTFIEARNTGSATVTGTFDSCSGN